MLPFCAWFLNMFMLMYQKKAETFSGKKINFPLRQINDVEIFKYDKRLILSATFSHDMLLCCIVLKSTLPSLTWFLMQIITQYFWHSVVSIIKHSPELKTDFFNVFPPRLKSTMAQMAHFSFPYYFTIPNSEIRSANFGIRNCEVVWKWKVSHLGHRRNLS